MLLRSAEQQVRGIRNENIKDFRPFCFGNRFGCEKNEALVKKINLLWQQYLVLKNIFSVTPYIHNSESIIH